MNNLNYILISDGSSDRILMSIIKWALDTNYPKLPINGRWADLRGWNCKNIPEKLKLARQLYNHFDILFYHRDAETCNIKILEERTQEIHNGINNADIIRKTICMIPIKMMESWLLFDVEAIKKASGNRNYKGHINLPAINRLEAIKQPKDELHQLLKQISGLKGRNLEKFNPHSATHLIAEYINDFSPLRQLKSFQRFEEELKTVVDSIIAKNAQ